MFEPHRHHCIVVLEQDAFILAEYWFNPGRPFVQLFLIKSKQYSIYLCFKRFMFCDLHIYLKYIIITRMHSRWGAIANPHTKVFDPQHPQVPPLAHYSCDRMKILFDMCFLFFICDKSTHAKFGIRKLN